MNILHLIENLDIGGAQTRIVNDLRLLDRKRFNNIVCSLTAGGRLVREIEGMGIKVFALNGAFNLKSLAKLLRIIRQNDIDVIHTQLFFTDLYGRLAGKLSGTPFIVTTIQSSVYEPDNVFLYSYKRQLLDSYSGRLCNSKFIAVSSFVKNSIINRLKFDPKKIEVIPNYIDFAALNRVCCQDVYALRKELGINSGDTVFITVSRLNPAKGLNYLLEAFSALSKQYPSVKLLIAGSGPSEVELKDISRILGIEDKAVFLGERNDIKELLHMSDIFVFPTLSEGLPLSLLEAMAVGKPCIASDIGPIKEIIKDDDNGILFRTKDSKDILRAMLEVMNDQQKSKQMLKKGSDFVKGQFDARMNVDLLESLYQNLGKH